MKTIFYLLTGLCLHIVLFIPSAHSIAISDSSATLTFDWMNTLSSYQYNINAGAYWALTAAHADLDGMIDDVPHDFTWKSDPNSSATAQYTSDAVGSAETLGSISATSTPTSPFSAVATGYTRADGIGINTPPDENVIASGDATLGFSIQPLSSGFQTLDFSYDFVRLMSQEDGSEGTSIYSWADIKISDSSGANLGDDFVEVKTGGSLNGLLSITADLSSTGWYFIQGHVYTSASARSPEQTSSVPEPATMLLFGTGLVGFVALGRKKIQQK